MTTAVTALFASAFVFLSAVVAPRPVAAAPATSTQTVVSGLTIPWDLAFAPDGTMLFTQRNAATVDAVLPGPDGDIDPGDERRTLAAPQLSSEVFVNGESGLMGIALHPSFASNRTLFTCHAAQGAPPVVRVVRWTVDAGWTTLTRAGTLVDGLPITGANGGVGRHGGCRPRIGPDGNLWIGTGDAANGVEPQSLTSLGGKVLRVDPDTGRGVDGNLGTGWNSGAPVADAGAGTTTALQYRGQLHVFAPVASGTGVRHGWFDPLSGWSAETLDTGGAAGGGTGVVAVAYRGGLHVFTDTATGVGIRHLWYDPVAGWSAETLDPGASGTGLSATVLVAADQLQVFGAPATGGGWRHVWFDGRGSGRWSAGTLDAAGTTGTASATTVYAANGQLQVFGPATGGGLRHGWFDPRSAAGWNFETLDAAGSTGTSAVTFTFGAQLQVLGDGTAPGIRQVFWDGRRWAASTLDAAGSDGTALSAVRWSVNGELHVFGRPTTGTGVRHTWWNGSGWPAETLPAGGAALGAASGTTATSWGAQLQVFGAGDDGLAQVFYAVSPADRRIMTVGHRNIQGLAVQPGTGRVYSAEHGTGVDDEVNLLENGANYGWDPVPGYDESRPMTDLVKFPAARPAVWSSGNPTVATSGMTFLDGPQWADWDGALAVACLKTSKLIVMRLAADGRSVVATTDTLTGFGRLRTPVQGPDGDLYVTTSNGGGNDRIIRVTPGTAVPPP